MAVAGLSSAAVVSTGITSHQDSHRHIYIIFRKSLAALFHKDHYLCYAGKGNFFAPCNIFKSNFGYFGRMLKACKYFRAHYIIADYMPAHFKDINAVITLFDYLIDLLRLCLIGNQNVRQIIPALGLHLGRV